MRSRNGIRGFTLIEVLVVVVIVGIISAVVILSFGIIGDDRSLQQHARRLSSLIELASDEALIQGRDFGLEFTLSGYRFLELDPLTNRWFEVVGDDLLRPRELEEQLELALVLEEREVTLEERFASVEDDSEERRGERDEDAGTEYDTGDDTEDDDGSARQEPAGPVLSDDFAPHVLILSSGDVTPFDLHILRPSDRTEVVVDMALTGEMEIRAGDESSS